MPYVYILECADGSYYTGSTWDLDRRLWEHQNGLGAKHTAKRLPVKLVFCEECDRVEDAYAREKQIQGWSRKKKQALMAGDWDRVHQLAECRNMSNSRNLGFDCFDSAQHESAQPTLLGPAQPILPDPATNHSSAGRSPTSPESHSASVPMNRSASLKGTKAEPEFEDRHAQSLAVSHTSALTGTEAERRAEEGRALSGVEGNARGSTDASVVPNHED